MRFLRACALAIVLAGCGGAFGQAMSRGDQFAQAGQWDKAAEAYEQATKLDPENTDAQIKLKEARHHQSLERIARGKALLDRGELAAGLSVIQEAARLDPDGTEAQSALSQANAQVLGKAEELLSGGDPLKAFELTTLVLKGSPNDPRAKAMDGQVRDALAERSYKKAMAFLDAGKNGNALMELAACVSYRPGYRDAKMKIGELKLALRKELLFTVQLASFGDATPSGDFGTALSPELLGQSLDDRLPLKVVRMAGGPEVASAPAQAATDRGIVVTGRFDGYTFKDSPSKTTRQCTYVCRTDTKPNPDYADAEQRVAQAEQQLSQAEDRVSSADKDVASAQQRVDEKQKDVDRAQQAADQARDQLEQCRSQNQGSSNGSSSSSACSSEESNYRSRQSDLDSARNWLSGPQGELSSARDRLSSAQQSRDSARRDRDQATATMRQTPRTIEVPVECPVDYAVRIRDVDAKITVHLTATTLQDKTNVLNDEPFDYEVKDHDEGWDAKPATCPQSGDPLHVMSEGDAKQQLVAQAIKGVRDKVMGTYDRYRQRFLADARKSEAEGLADEAVEAYVRYVLTGPSSIDPKDQQQIAGFLAKTRGFGKLESLKDL